MFQKQLQIKIRNTDVIGYTLGIFVTSIYFFTNHWIFNNILGIGFTIAAISMLKVQKFSEIYLLLWLLFFYDIFWVYGTDVMVTIAKRLDVPIKLKFPMGSENNKFSILGLGDIILPGVLGALCIKFDVDNCLEKLNLQIKNLKNKFNIDSDKKNKI